MRSIASARTSFWRIGMVARQRACADEDLASNPAGLGASGSLGKA